MLKPLHLARQLRTRFARVSRPAPKQAAQGEQTRIASAQAGTPIVQHAALAALELPTLRKQNAPEAVDVLIRQHLGERVDPDALDGQTAERVRKFRTMTLDVANQEHWVSSSYLYRGSFGAVSVAIDAAGQPWAVKVMRTQPKNASKTQAISAQSFASELKFTQKYLSSAAHAAVDTDGELYVFMPLHAGSAHHLTHGMSFDHDSQRAVVRSIGAQVAGDLAHMHASGDLMFDLKPGNIVISSSGAAQMSDFGAAISTADMRAKCTTDSWEIPGTAMFAALEWRQAFVHGSQHLGSLPALDVWSLGMTLLDMCHSLNRSPFSACVTHFSDDVLQRFFVWRASMLTEGVFDLARLQAAAPEADVDEFTGYFQDVAHRDPELCSLLLGAVLAPAACRVDAATVCRQLRALQPEGSEADAQAHRSMQAWARENTLHRAVLDVLREHPSRTHPAQNIQHAPVAPEKKPTKAAKKPLMLRLLELAQISIATKD